MKAQIVFAVLLAVAWVVVTNFSTSINTSLGIAQLADSDSSILATNALQRWQTFGNVLVVGMVGFLFVTGLNSKPKKETNED
jgi:hypothetical protein